MSRHAGIDNGLPYFPQDAGSSLSRSNGVGAPAGSKVATNGTSTNAGGASLNGSSNGDTHPSASQHDGDPEPPVPPTYRGHNREEVTRLLMQALGDMGYKDAAESVSRDSGVALESETVSTFRRAILSGSWSQAESLLQGMTDAGAGDASSGLGGSRASQGNGLVLTKGANRNIMRFWIRQQKYLEYLELEDVARALAVLREELNPIANDQAKVQFLSSLLMCERPDDVKAKAAWDGANGNSRRRLLSELSKCISPSVMLPESRLANLLQSVKQNQIDTCRYHTAPSSPSLYTDHVCPRSLFPTECAVELDDLSVEAWQVQYSPTGHLLAACGLNGVAIWDSNFKLVGELRAHQRGVANVAWSPDGTMLVTCSQDKTARLWRVSDSQCLRTSKKFSEPVSSCVWANDGQSLVLGTLDSKHSLVTYRIDGWEMESWGMNHRVQDLAGSPDGQWLAAVDDHCTVHVYWAATRELQYELELAARPTSVSISEDSRLLLVNKQDGEAQLIDLHAATAVRKFLGQVGGQYLIRASLGGANESFVVSGSDDGSIVIWHKTMGCVVERLQAHRPRCNAVAWKPDDPSTIASCGDDGRVKIWTSKAQAREMRSRAR